MVDSFTANGLDMYFSLSWSLTAVVLCSAPNSSVLLGRVDEEVGVPRGDSSGLPAGVWSIWALSQPHQSCQRGFPLSAFALGQQEVEFSLEVGARS